MPEYVATIDVYFTAPTPDRAAEIADAMGDDAAASHDVSGVVSSVRPVEES